MCGFEFAHKFTHTFFFIQINRIEFYLIVISEYQCITQTCIYSKILNFTKVLEPLSPPKSAQRVVKQQVALIFRLRAHQICARIFQVIEQTSLIHLAVLLVIAKHDKTKKRHKRTLCGKSDWEKTCDDGGKFFGW